MLRSNLVWKSNSKINERQLKFVLHLCDHFVILGKNLIQVLLLNYQEGEQNYLVVGNDVFTNTIRKDALWKTYLMKPTTRSNEH